AHRVSETLKHLGHVPASASVKRRHERNLTDVVRVHPCGERLESILEGDAQLLVRDDATPLRVRGLLRRLCHRGDGPHERMAGTHRRSELLQVCRKLLCELIVLSLHEALDDRVEY